MKKGINNILTALLFGAVIASCAGEEDMTPSGAIDNYFAVGSQDASEDAALRRKFYADNGIYLLFNDTLRHELVGKDVAGDDAYFTETIDFNYNLNDVGDSEFDMSYITSTADKKAAVEFVEKYVVPHFKGGALSPYSFFLADKILEYGYADSYAWNKTWNERSCISCMRCIGLSVGAVGGMTENEKLAYAADICKSVLASRLSYNDSRLDAFYAPANDRFYDYLMDFIPTWDDSAWDGVDMTVPNEYGFLELKGTSYWGYYFPSMSDDYNAYFNMVMSMSLDEVTEKYGSAPVVMQRYGILRDIIVELGYKF